MDLKILGQHKVSLLRSAGRVAQDLGMSAFLVGGAVRDVCLGRTSPDLDVVVVGKAIEFAQELSRVFDGQVKTHQRFQTATVVLKNGLSVDCVTARKENYPKPGALPVIVPGIIEEDLFRRDFTMNSIAVSLSPKGYGDIVDPYRGLRDIRRKKIKVLHEKSFCDDPTRIFRAVRFLKRFKFSLQRKTAQYLNEAVRSGSIKTVTQTRLFTEMMKIFEEERVAAMCSHLYTWGIRDAVLHKGEMPMTTLRRIECRREKLKQSQRFSDMDWKKIFLTGYCEVLKKDRRLQLFQDVQMSKKDQEDVVSKIHFHKAWEKASSNNTIESLLEGAATQDIGYALCVTDRFNVLEKII